MKRIEVAAGVVEDSEGRVLICCRKGKLEGLWEFPGGKREPGESYGECLERELWEELALHVRAGQILCELNAQENNIHLAFVHAELCASAALTLNVHSQAAWVCWEELRGYSFCPADKAFVEQGMGGLLKPLSPKA
ncbi:MAG: NUDIX domain-containing protein [Clostridia bacterium]